MATKLYTSGMLFLVALLAVISACTTKPAQMEKLIFVQAPANMVSTADIRSAAYRYTDGLIIRMGNPGEAMESMENLAPGFVSARAPQVSYDGMTLVFSGKKTAEDSWQVWTRNLTEGTLTQVTMSKENCTDPTWLPDGRIAFSRQVSDETAGTYHALFTISVDGCCEQRITYQPHDDLCASVLEDGRLLFSSQQVYPEPGSLKFMAMRPDGTKAELFYQPDSVVSALNRATYTQNGKVVFAENGLFRAVSFNRPLHSVQPISLQDGASVQSAYAKEDGNLLASLQKSATANYEIITVNSGDMAGTSDILQDASNHLIEAVQVAVRPTPKKLPSLMNMEDPNGYIVCLNADASTIQVNYTAGKSSKIQVLDYRGIVGETEIAEDGSFYVALPADQPLRFQTVTEDGAIVRGPSSWIWVRPSEHRGCVGCHEDSEIVPENVVPMAVAKAPVALVK